MSFAPLRRCAVALLLSPVLALHLGCDAAEENLAPAPPAAAAEESERSDQKKIIAFGDSLTAGFGIGLDEAYPAVLQEMIDREGYPYEVINAGVSGETSAGGVRRLSWVLDQPGVEAIILALGGNDGLRGLPPQEMKKNLATMVEEAKSRDITVLLAGFQAPPDARDRYVRDFVAVFPEVAEEHDVTLMPSLLQGVIGVSELNQPDGKHPNAEGARVVAENVWSYLKPLLTTAP